MASIENERDDPEPDLLDDPPPSTSSALGAATGASNISFNSDVETCIRPANENGHLNRSARPSLTSETA